MRPTSAPASHLTGEVPKEHRAGDEYGRALRSKLRPTQIRPPPARVSINQARTDAHDTTQALAACTPQAQDFSSTAHQGS